MSEIDVIDMYVRIVNLMLSIRFRVFHISIFKNYYISVNVSMILVYSFDSLYDHFFINFRFI